MDPHDFYQLALQLANSPHAAELRTAISRAYYATYHVGVTLLESLGFRLIHAAVILASFLLPWTLRQHVCSMDYSRLPCRKDARSPAVCIRSGPAGHGEVRNRLSNSGDPEVMRVGNQLGQLQSQRIAADYRLRHTSVENPKTAQAVVQQAGRMIQILDTCFAEPKRTQIMQAIQKWEQRISRT